MATTETDLTERVARLEGGYDHLTTKADLSQNGRKPAIGDGPDGGATAGEDSDDGDPSQRSDRGRHRGTAAGDRITA